MKFLFILVCSTLCSQPSTNIFSFDLSFSDGIYTLKNQRNITDRNSYNNQPSFTPDGKSILYTSMRDGKQTDIYQLNTETLEEKQLTKTSTSEYSPILTPEKESFSTVVVEPNGDQRLWVYPITGGEGKRLMMTDKIGYHCWITTTQVAIFQLTEPFSIKYVNTADESELFISNHIGRSLFLNHSTNTFDFLYKSKHQSLIKSVSLGGNTLKTSIPIDSKATDFFVTRDGHYFTGLKNKLYVYIPTKNSWTLVKKLDLKNISRIAINNNSTKIVVVSDI